MAKHSSFTVFRVFIIELPFGHEYNSTDYRKLKKNALCIRTYVSCLDTQVRNILTQNGFNLSLSPPQAIFDYPSFTHKFIINNLVYYISICSRHFIDRRILFREICKLILNRSFLNHFELERISEFFVDDFRDYSDLFGPLLKLPDATKLFKKFESFTSDVRDVDNQTDSLYESLTLNCDNVLNKDLFLICHSQVQLLAKLISFQKRLENLSINENIQGFHSLLWAVFSQKDTLKSLRLYLLYIKNCTGLHESGILLFASSFTQLTILNYHTKVTELTLHNLIPEQAIAIFNNNFNELRNFSFNYGRERFSANELLCQMAENVPESLETIEIRMGRFTADSLRKYAEGWYCKGRG
ncbi:6695_t:CDS:2 [Diversispora eburnea]|uniref:6695_t:CDS:1 n=1 Tax=Diversispora eburnea TaxID=1213867 RepID=A0A9N8V1W4_9GLOM|nr:6695_t:CDS:2 [Diversispora eburnea]